MQLFILLIFELQTPLLHSSDAINTSFRILYIQDGIQDKTRQVLQPCGCSILSVGMSYGFVTDPIPCLIE